MYLLRGSHLDPAMGPVLVSIKCLCFGFDTSGETVL
jgi:hypothetical protein